MRAIKRLKRIDRNYVRERENASEQATRASDRQRCAALSRCVRPEPHAQVSVLAGWDSAGTGGTSLAGFNVRCPPPARCHCDVRVTRLFILRR